MITIVDYGLGNLTSIKNALDKLGISNAISDKISDMKKADKLILPGVGAAAEGMKNLKEKKLDLFLKQEVLKGKPLLGICLGMQLLMDFSEEGNAECLKLIKGTVKKFQTKLKVPQIGWNDVQIKNEKSKVKNIFDGIENESYFYFVHSYYCKPDDKNVIIGITDYETEFCSVLMKENIFGVQFHPEKSGDVGLQMLKNFSLLSS